MNIQEVSKQVGVSPQNIRFYEKKGLIQPRRDENNDYRIYTQEDIHRLECIKILRMLDVSVEDIKHILKSDQLGQEMEKHKESLKKQMEDLKGAIQVCEQLSHETSLQNLDTQAVLHTIDNLQKQGNSFKQFMADYKELAYLEAKKKFSFMPDNACMNKAEFAEALKAYAKETHKELVILKETMYPEFELDGVKYKAERQFGRYGAVVLCETLEPEKLKAAHISRRNKILFKLFYSVLPVIILISLVVGPQMVGGNPWYVKLIFGLGELAVIFAYGRLYYHNQHD